MKYLLVLAAFALGGCEEMHHVTCAPKVLVEACLQEAHSASAVGFGPYCASLNKWAQYHDWAYGGGPPLTPKPTVPEAQALESK